MNTDPKRRREEEASTSNEIPRTRSSRKPATRQRIVREEDSSTDEQSARETDKQKSEEERRKRHQQAFDQAAVARDQSQEKSKREKEKLEKKQREEETKKWQEEQRILQEKIQTKLAADRKSTEGRVEELRRLEQELTESIHRKNTENVNLRQGRDLINQEIAERTSTRDRLVIENERLTNENTERQRTATRRASNNELRDIEFQKDQEELIKQAEEIRQAREQEHRETGKRQQNLIRQQEELERRTAELRELERQQRAEEEARRTAWNNERTRVEQIEEENARLRALQLQSIRGNDEETMALPLERITELIQTYSGEPAGLNGYIASMDAIWGLMAARTQEERTWVTLALKAKLRGKAAEINGDATLVDWPLMKAALKAKIQIPVVSIRCAELELTTATQGEKESTEDFIERVKKLRETLTRALEPEASEDQKVYIRSDTERKTISTLEIGLRSKILRDLLLGANNATLQETINFIREKEIKLRLQNQVKPAQQVVTCNFCHKANHTESECRRKTAGNNQNQSQGADQPRRDLSTIRCFNCNNMGHYSSQCNYNQNDNGRTQNQDGGNNSNDQGQQGGNYGNDQPRNYGYGQQGYNSGQPRSYGTGQQGYNNGHPRNYGNGQQSYNNGQQNGSNQNNYRQNNNGGRNDNQQRGNQAVYAANEGAGGGDVSEPIVNASIIQSSEN